MGTTRSANLPRLILALLILVLGSVLPQSLWAQATLENPQPASLQSGIGVISGWVCTATRVEIEIDGGARMQAAYGTSREDTRAVCGDANNGFGLLVNWNLFGEGAHTLRALADGVEFAQVAFVVATLGLGEFPRGLSGSFPVPEFPQAGRTVQLSWQESLQNFVLTGGGSGSGGSGGAPPRVLENPQPGSAQSGIGVVSGWVCDATLIEIEIDGGARMQAAYGTSRDDTRAVCGDANNGFGLLVNWNLFGDGTHTLRALADGVEFAQVTLTVTTLGLGEFVRGVSGRAELENFPEVGRQSRVQWQESLQNFVLEGALLPGENASAGSIVEGTASDGQSGQALFEATLPYDPRTLLLQLQALLSGGQTSVDTKTLERPQATAGVFFACDERLSFEQGGRVFTSADFRWLDGAGNDVCQEVAGGSTLETIVVVNPGVSLNFTLLFRISYNNTLVVEADAGGSPSPMLSVSPPSVDFGNVAVGSSKELTFTVTNSGGGTLTGSATTAAPFSMVLGETFSLSAGQSQAVTVRFSPTSEGSASGSVSVSSNGGSATVSLLGVGSAAATPPQLSVTPNTLDFGSVEVGSTKDMTLTVMNSGGGTLEGQLVYTLEGAVGFESPFSVASGASQVFTLSVITDHTTRLGPFSGQVQLTSNGGAATIPVTGTVVDSRPPQLAVTPSALDFGEVARNSTESLTVTLTNTGGGTLEGRLVYTLEGAVGFESPFSVAPGGSQPFTLRVVTDHTTRLGPFSGEVQITSNGGAATIPVTGTVVQ